MWKKVRRIKEKNETRINENAGSSARRPNSLLKWCPSYHGHIFYPISRLELLLTTSLTGSVSGSKFCGIGGEAGRVPAGQCRVLQRVSALVPASLRDVEVGAG